MTDPGPFISYLSPSAIESFACARRWFFKSVLRVPCEQTAQSAEGEEIHRQIEMWLTKGIGPTNPSAVASIPHLPPPLDPGTTVEQQFYFAMNDAGELVPLEDGIVFAARLDVLWRGVVIDHKSVYAYPNPFALTEETLPRNIQAQICQLATSAHTLKWHYLPRRKEQCHPVVAKPTLEETRRRFHLDVYPTARTMVNLKKTWPRTLEGANTLPCDTSHCWDYGNICPFSYTCTGFVFSEETSMASGRLADLLAGLDAATTTTAPTSLQGATVQVNPPEAEAQRPTVEAEIAGETPPAEPAPPAEPKKRGRPAKATTAAPPATPVADVAAPETAPAAEAAAPAPPTPAESADDALFALIRAARARGLRVQVIVG